MGSIPVGGLGIIWLENASSLFSLYPSRHSIYHYTNNKLSLTWNCTRVFFRGPCRFWLANSFQTVKFRNRSRPRSLLPNYFRDMLTLASLIAELIFENSQFGCEISKQWKYQFVWQKTLKIRSFLVKFDFCWATHLFFFILFSFSFSLKKIDWNFHSVPLTCIVYPIVPGSL